MSIVVRVFFENHYANSALTRCFSKMPCRRKAKAVAKDEAKVRKYVKKANDAWGDDRENLIKEGDIEDFVEQVCQTQKAPSISAAVGGGAQ